MADHTRFEIQIYRDGVVATVHLRGTKRYLIEKAFLDQLIGHPYPAHLAPRPVPDPHQDHYMLDREQMAAYVAFRRKLKRIDNDMPVRKAQARLEHGAETAIPTEFQSFCSSLAMGLKYAGSTPETVVEYAVNIHSREEREAALRFLDRIAASNYDADALQRVWAHCMSDFGLTCEGDLRAFFLTVRAELAKLVKPTIARHHSRC